MKLKELLETLESKSEVKIIFFDSWTGEVKNLYAPFRMVDKWYSHCENRNRLDCEISKIKISDDKLIISAALPFDKEEWLDEMYRQYLKDEEVDCIDLPIRDIMYVYNMKTPSRIGWSKVNPNSNDKFDYHTGTAIAYARYKGYEIPKDL